MSSRRAARGKHLVGIQGLHAEIQRLLDLGVRHVTIGGAHDGSSCEACTALYGKRFTIEAVIRNPPLPPAECDGGPRHECRCSYEPDMNELFNAPFPSKHRRRRTSLADPISTVCAACGSTIVTKQIPTYPMAGIVAIILGGILVFTNTSIVLGAISAVVGLALLKATGLSRYCPLCDKLFPDLS